MFSVDMEKVIMLPRMPGVKQCIFTRRLIGYHKTFAPLDEKQQAKPYGIIWHEAIRGRKAEDVTSIFLRVMRSFRDARELTLWGDNCSSQNKNWALMTALCNEVNKSSDPGKLMYITSKYLNVGHTFMSADSFHHKVEKEMKRVKNVYDFDDFSKVIGNCGNAINMHHSDFMIFENGVSQGKFTSKPLLDNVKVFQFQSGSSKILWKESHQQKEFYSGETLKKKLATKILKNVDASFETRKENRDIPTIRRDDILKKTPLMPANRQTFWKDISINDTWLYLIDHEEE